MAEWAPQGSCPWTETSKEQAETVRRFNRICYNSGKESKVYSNQMKAEWRKGERQRKNGRKALWCFYCPYPLPPSPAQWQSLKKPAPMTRPFLLASPGVAVSLNLSGSYQRADASCSSLSQARKAPGVAGEPCEVVNKLQPSRVKDDA